MTESPYTSLDVGSSPIQVGFPPADLAAAKVMVKFLVRRQLRKGPTEMLILPDSALEKWFDEDAEVYLREQYKKRNQPIEVR